MKTPHSSVTGSNRKPSLNHDHEIWREKYLSTLDEIEQHQESSQATIDLLKRGILSVSLAGDGLDTKLDGSLQELRNEIKNTQNDAQVSRLIQQIEAELVRLETERSESHQTQLDSISAALKVLGKSSIDADSKKELKSFQKRIKSNLKDHFEQRSFKDDLVNLLLPLLNKLSAKFVEENPSQGLWNRLSGNVGISKKHETSLKVKTDHQDTSQSSSNSAHQPVKPSVSSDQPAEALFRASQQFTSKLLKTEDNTAVLEQVTKQLLSEVSSADELSLSESYPKILNLIGLRRTHQAKTFLDYLNEIAFVLAKIKKTVEQSKVNQQKIKTTEVIRSRNLRGKLQKIRYVLDTSTDLEEVKQQTQEQLDEILTSLENSDDELLREHNTLSGINDNQADTVSSARNKTIDCIEDTRTSLKAEKNDVVTSNEETDELTGLKNRHWFTQNLDKDLNSESNCNDPLCLCVVEVMSVQSINDTYGANAGDKALKLLAKEIQTRVLKLDILAYGGNDKFLILMPNTTLADGVTRTELLESQLRRLPFRFKDSEVNVDLAFGMAPYARGDTAESFIQRASQKLEFIKSDQDSIQN